MRICSTTNQSSVDHSGDLALIWSHTTDHDHMIVSFTTAPILTFKQEIRKAYFGLDQDTHTKLAFCLIITSSVHISLNSADKLIYDQ